MQTLASIIHTHRDKVKEFNRQYDLPLFGELEQSDRSDLIYRAGLIQEEAGELFDEAHDPNSTEFLKELTDLYYVTIGVYAHFNMKYHGKFDWHKVFFLKNIIDAAAHTKAALCLDKFCRREIQTKLDYLTFAIRRFADQHGLFLDISFDFVHQQNMDKIWSVALVVENETKILAQGWTMKLKPFGYIVRNTSGKVIKPTELNKLSQQQQQQQQQQQHS